MVFTRLTNQELDGETKSYHNTWLTLQHTLTQYKYMSTIKAVESKILFTGEQKVINLKAFK